LEVCSNWDDVFVYLGTKVRMAPMSRQNININAHYTTRKGHPGTSQFEDMCLTAGIKDKIDLRLDWAISNPRLIDDLKSRVNGRRIMVVQMPRTPMDRKDRFGWEIAPNWDYLKRMVEVVNEDFFTIQVGLGKPLIELDIDYDLSNKTKVRELIDVASVADAFMGQISGIIPLAESFSKPLVVLWSQNIKKAKNPFVKRITPEKILHRESSICVQDSDSLEKTETKLRSL